MRRPPPILTAALALLPTAAFAGDIYSDVLAPGSVVTVDGLLDEWRGLPGDELEIVEKISYKGAGDLAATVQSLHDKTYLYFAITVRDDAFRRTGAGTAGEDKLLMWFGGDATKSPISLSFLPGDLSKIQQELKFNGKKIAPVTGSKVELQALEGFKPKESLWTVELALPWEKLPAELRGRERVPFCAAILDGDDKSRPRLEAVAASCATSKGEPLSLGALVRAEDEKIFEGFLADTGQSRSSLVKEFYVDAGGDLQADRLVVVGPYVGILGTGLGEGFYYYYRLGIKTSSDIKDIQLMDVDGDGKQNLVVRSLEYDSSGAYSQEILRVFGFTGKLFTPIFGQELAGAQKEGTLSSRFEWKKKAKGYELTVYQAEATGVTQQNYVDIDAKDDKDYKEILLPWGSAKKAAYRFVSGEAEPLR
jgi:hypothetical protein